MDPQVHIFITFHIVIFTHTEKTGVSNFECQNVNSQSELLDSTTLFPKFFLFGQGDTHLIFCLTVTRVSESL